MSVSGFSTAVEQALASSTMYSFGSLIKPNVKYIPKEQVRGYIAPPFEQWVIQGETFENSLYEQFQQISPGETRMLIAATGVGKTTVLPYKLAQLSGKAGIVLMPRNKPVARAVGYVKNKYADAPEPRVFIDVLRSEYIRKPVTGSAVFYASAADFLPRFHADRDFIKRLNIAFIYLDEAHVFHPAYAFMRTLVGLSFFSDTRVFYGTATQPGVSMIMSGSVHKTKPLPIPAAYVPIDAPESTPVESPVHYARIASRVLFFVPTDQHVNLWDKYFDNNDVRTFCYRTHDSSKRLDLLATALNTKVPMVVVSTSELEISHTFNFDVCVDSGYTQEFFVDYSAPSAFLKVRPVTQSERTQRAGRVQRHLPGVAYYVDVQVSQDGPDLTLTNGVYMWAWARMFNISIKNETVSQFDEMFAGCNDEVVSLMLCSKVHPVLILPYITDEGTIYSGWGQVKHVFHTNDAIGMSDEDNEDAVENWSLYNTGPRAWLSEPMQYRARCGFPEQWEALPAILWYSYISGKTNVGLAFDNRSVVSALVPQQKKQLSRKITTASKRNVNRAFSVITTKKTQSPVFDGFEFPTIEEMEEPVEVLSQARVSSRTVAGPSAPKSVVLRQVTHTRKPSSSITEEVPRSIQEWIDTNHSPERRRSRKSSSSGSSHHKCFIELKKVNPSKYKMHKFYPMEESILSMFLTDETPHSVDYERFSSLIRRKKNFVDLANDVSDKHDLQTEFFMSVIRVHNYSVMEKLQIKAGGFDKPSFFSKFVGQDPQEVTRQIEQSANLLQAMYMESFFVGIDKRTAHTTRASTSFDFQKIERYAVSAKYLLHVGPVELENELQKAKDCCSAVKDANKRVVGTVWKVGRAEFLPFHVMKKAHNTCDFVIVGHDDTVDFAVLRSDVFFRPHVTMRPPVSGEQVVMVGHCPKTHQSLVLGPYETLEFGDVWCVDGTLNHGFSGFGVISIVDYALVGMYLGFFNTDMKGKEFGHFVPSGAFMSIVARAFK